MNLAAQDLKLTPFKSPGGNWRQLVESGYEWLMSGGMSEGGYWHADCVVSVHYGLTCLELRPIRDPDVFKQ